MNTFAAEFLTVPYHPIWDLVRLCVVTMAGTIGLWLMRVAVFRTQQPQDPYTKWSLVGMSGAVVLVVIQSLDAMGEDFPVWRAPLFVFVLLSFWRAVNIRM